MTVVGKQEVNAAVARVRDRLSATMDAMRWRKLEGVLDPPRFFHSVGAVYKLNAVDPQRLKAPPGFNP